MRSRISPTIDGMRKLIAFGRKHDLAGKMIGKYASPVASSVRVVQNGISDGRDHGLMGKVFFSPTAHAASFTTPKGSSSTTAGPIGPQTCLDK